MTRYGMLIDTKNCIGCYACRAACQRQNGLDPEIDYIRYEERETGTFPVVHVESVPLQCMHCEDAPCVSICPTGASYITEDGIVRVDENKCIGCRYCMAACPYQVRVHNTKTGAVEKCRFCTVEAYEGRAVTCSCVEACVTGCRIFGDLDDPEGELSRAIVEKNALPISGDLTKAKIFYVR
ncbi:4Fe-4S dicluster domain-containing protein [Parvibacter caecicola]|uniref:4Fe-4S dicluster domain-containing protein n=1 Tax=Parvibacter caecicola TaxID=747645 RepID=UPI0027305297|nr:4Fe-4S dicluster domain-containing protein [Parvibacter caecicola]